MTWSQTVRRHGDDDSACKNPAGWPLRGHGEPERTGWTVTPFCPRARTGTAAQTQPCLSSSAVGLLIEPDDIARQGCIILVRLNVNGAGILEGYFVEARIVNSVQYSRIQFRTVG